MLLEFRMKNVYSYKEEISFSLLAPLSRVKKRYTDNFVSICGYNILKSAIIVGENAGGKSNFIKGIQLFKSFFGESSKDISSSSSITFLGINDEQSFSITTTNGDEVFFYTLIICKYGIKEENLFCQTNKHKKRQHIFSYKASYHDYNIEQKMITANVELNIPANHEFEKPVFDNIKNNSNKGLIISSLSILGVPKTMEFIKTINNIIVPKDAFDLQLSLTYILDKKISEEDLSIMNKKEFLDIFRLVDSSISKIEIDKDNPFVNTLIYRQTESTYAKKHVILDSTGVRNFLAFSLLIYKVIYEDLSIFNDEMDSTFNPILTSKVITLIHASNSHGQFIFTTHNVFNMNLNLLLKEQMFICNKDNKSLESTIYSLSEFSDIRYDANEKIYEYYMQGLLGGIDNE